MSQIVWVSDERQRLVEHEPAWQFHRHRVLPLLHFQQSNSRPVVSGVEWTYPRECHDHTQPVELNQVSRNRKIREYFLGGTQLVWVFDADASTVTSYTSVKRTRVWTRTETLDGGKVLPGFQIDLAEFWNDPHVTLSQPN